jgi:hypothetical protein
LASWALLSKLNTFEKCFQNVENRLLEKVKKTIKEKVENFNKKSYLTGLN